MKVALSSLCPVLNHSPIMIAVHGAEDEVDHLDNVVLDRGARQAAHLVGVHVRFYKGPNPVEQKPLQLFAQPIS